MVNDAAALLAAVQTGTDAEVAELLRSGADPNGVLRTADDELTEFKHSPLVLAMIAGSLEKVSVLLAAGADTHDIARIDLSQPPLDLVDNALQHLVDNWDGSKHSTFIEIGELLLASGVDVNSRDTSGLTALHRAVVRNDQGLCKFLVDHDADPTISSEERYPSTPIDVAVELERTEILDLLREKCADTKIEMARLFSPLHRVAEFGNWHSMLLVLVKRGLDINARDIRGNRPLDLLPWSGKVDLNAFYAFIAVGAQPSSTMLEDHEVKTPVGKALRMDRLSAAVRCGSADIVARVLAELPRSASRTDIAGAEAAARRARGIVSDVLRQWLSKQAADAVMSEV